MSISAHTLELLAARRADLGTTLDGQTLRLVEAWVLAWDELAPEFDAAMADLFAAAKDGRVTGSQAAKNVRLRKALTLAAGRLDELAGLTQVTVQADLMRTILAAAQTQIDVIMSQLPPAGRVATLPTFTRVDTAAMDAIVQRITERIAKDTAPLSMDAQVMMRRELVRGVAVGENPRETARRILKATEGHFNGGLNRALTISRTETLDAHRAATQAADLANNDLTTMWMWGAELGARTCIACLSMHGTRYPIEEPGPIGHQNCRCDRIPVTKTWAELGFTGIEEPPSLEKSSQEWFDGLTLDTQRQIMGPERLNLYQSGEIRWEDLNRRQENPGWRDSVTITPVRDLLVLP